MKFDDAITMVKERMGDLPREDLELLFYEILENVETLKEALEVKDYLIREQTKLIARQNMLIDIMNKKLTKKKNNGGLKC